MPRVQQVGNKPGKKSVLQQKVEALKKQKKTQEEAEIEKPRERTPKRNVDADLINDLPEKMRPQDGDWDERPARITRSANNFVRQLTDMHVRKLVDGSHRKDVRIKLARGELFNVGDVVGDDPLLAPRKLASRLDLYHENKPDPLHPGQKQTRKAFKPEVDMLREWDTALYGRMKEVADPKRPGKTKQVRSKNLNVFPVGAIENLIREVLVELQEEGVVNDYDKDLSYKVAPMLREASEAYLQERFARAQLLAHENVPLRQVNVTTPSTVTERHFRAAGEDRMSFFNPVTLRTEPLLTFPFMM